MIVSRGGLLNQKGNIRKRMLVVGITGLLAIAFTALLLPTMAGAAVKGPYINILAPGAGSIWRGTKEITWEQVDVSGEMTIEWATGDTAAPTDPAAWTLIATRSTATAGTYSCSWDTTSVSDGTNYFVRVRPTGEYTPIGTSGQFTIDNTPPQPASAEFMNDTQVNITFNENLNTSYIDSTRFALSSSSVSHISSSSAAVSTSNMQVVTVTFDKGTIPASVQANGDNCLIIAYDAVRDLAGNPLTPATVSMWVTGDSTTPVVDTSQSSVTSPVSEITGTQVIITLNEAVSEAQTAASFAIYTKETSPVIAASGTLVGASDATNADKWIASMSTVSVSSGVFCSSIYTVKVWNLEDRAGNAIATDVTTAITISTNYIVDASAPTSVNITSVLSPPIISQSTAQFTISASDDLTGLYTVLYRVGDSGNYVTATSVELNPDLTQGVSQYSGTMTISIPTTPATYATNVYVKFVDHPNCQNAATDVTAITFDSVGPVVSINAVSCNSSHYASSATPTFEISATDNTASVASVHWEIKQGTTLIEASNVTVSPATYATTVTVHPTVALSNDVEYTFYATATDGIGNVCTPATYGFWVYAETANTAEATSGEFTKDNQAVVNFSEPVWVVHPASFAFTSPAAATGISVEAATTSGVYAKQVTLTLSGLTAEIQTNGATLSISQAAVETVAGYNLAATQPTVFISGDTTRPQVTSIDINPSLASATTVTFTFVFNEKMATSVTPTVKYGTTTPDQPATPGSWNTGATAWTATATFGPGDTGNYQVEISGAKDRANNEIISATSNFTVVSDPATITITGPTVPATTKTPQFTVVAQQVNPVTIVSVTYDISGPTVLTGQTVVASPNATYVTSTFTVSQALSDGNYVMTVTATDSLGNVGTQQYSFEVEATLNITHAEFTTDKDVTILFDKTIQDIDAAYVVASGATTTVSGSQATISGNTVYVTLQSSVPVTWQTAQSPATIKVKAGHVTDTYGYTPASDTTCTISADTTNPSIISVDVSPATAITATQVTITAAFNEKMSTSGVTVKIGTTNVTTFSWNGTYTQLVAKQWMSQEGNYSILVEAQDRASNPCSDSSKTFILDKTAPGVSFTAKPDSLTNDNTPQFTVSASDATSNVTSVEYQVDSGSWTSVSITAATSVTATFTTSALADGSHTIKARATDQLGNVTASANYATYTFTVDTTGPDVSITSPADGTIVNGTISIEASASDATTSVSKVEFYYGTTLITSDTTSPYAISWDTTGVADGTYNLKAKAYDTVGNSTDSSLVSVTVDNTGPDVSFTAKPSTPTSDSTPSFTVKATDSITVSSVEYQVDTGSWTSLTITPATSVTASFTTSALSDGSHTVKAKATDYLGNTGSAATYTFTVDTTAPQVSTVTVSPSPVPTPTNPVTVTITVEFNESMSSATPTVTFGKVSPYDAYSVSGTWVDNTQWQGTYSITSGVETGKYYISISDAKDLAGNKMATDATTTFTITPLSEKKETVGKSGGTVDLGDGTKVEIPAGALDIDTEIVIKRQPDHTPAFENTTYLTATGIVREFGPAGLVFNKDVTIVIPYDEDELPAGVDEEDLHLYFWDGANWQPVGNEVVDTVNNTITVTVNHFTIFQAVGDTTPASALQFKVYLTKNPFLRGGSTTFVFTLPKKGNVTLKIYDTSGDLVRTLIDNELYNAGKASKVWDGDNDFGNYVGTGLYLYRFEVKYTAGGSDKQIKLVGVVK